MEAETAPTAHRDGETGDCAPQALLKAYAASALEMERLQKGPDQAPALTLGPVAVEALVGDVVQGLAPLARQSELTLMCDARSAREGVCCADAAQLHRVVSHLVLRALAMEQAPGHVRVMASLTAPEAHVLILSPTPETTMARRRGAACYDLAAARRLIQAMGGSLVLEPRRAGYLPLCIALPALAAASPRRAA